MVGRLEGVIYMHDHGPLELSQPSENVLVYLVTVVMVMLKHNEIERGKQLSAQMCMSREQYSQKQQEFAIKMGNRTPLQQQVLSSGPIMKQKMLTLVTTSKGTLKKYTHTNELLYYFVDKIVNFICPPLSLPFSSRCQDCSKLLAHGKYSVLDGAFYCPAHYEQHYKQAGGNYTRAS